MMTLVGRDVPDCESEVMFTDHELAFLDDYGRSRGLSGPNWRAGRVRLLAHLGGYRGEAPPEPGHQLMGRGRNALTGATLGH